MKKYVSQSNISINVILPGGKNRHVSFTPLTGGGSVYFAENSAMQSGLESHRGFGTLFRLEESAGVAEPKPPKRSKEPKEPNPKPKKEVTGEEASLSSKGGSPAYEGGASGVRVVRVSDPDDAKEYLSEHCGVSRTKLKDSDSIIAAGEAHGVRFEGL